LSKNLEIHKVFLRFFAFVRQKICSPICALGSNQWFLVFYYTLFLSKTLFFGFGFFIFV